ncbi:SET domain-containing protein 4 [Anopheles cruzii]|uniref:SET domain-containing protein 4 n=1 Tax=Anopheles cruzii TaxID=68878 RepID=UPI0022EC4B33|nr:SET domain-containing protein 4 [Anopheles cruzii]
MQPADGLCNAREMTTDGSTNSTKTNRKNGSRHPRECLEHVPLFRWLKELGWRNETALRIATFERTGKGLYSRRSIAGGDCIIALPFEALIGWNTIEKDEEFRAMFNGETIGQREASEKIPFQTLLAFYLCAQEHKKNPRTEAYLQALPKTFSNPYFCSKAELLHFPEVLLRTMVEQNQQINVAFERIVTALHSQWQGVFELERFKWAFFAVNTRSVYVDPEVTRMINSFLPAGTLFEDLLSDDPSMALAPLLDFFNHHARTQTKSGLSLTTRQVQHRLSKGKPLDLWYTLRTHAAHPAGRQIFIDYGTHNNTSLLLEYGFTVPDNPDDFFELTLDDINAFIKHDPELRCLRLPREKYRFIGGHRLAEQLFFVEDDLLSHNLSVCLTILFVEQNVHHLRAIAFASTPPLGPIRAIALRLLDFVALQMNRSIAGLSSLASLTPAAIAYREYGWEGVRFLNKIKSKF